MKSWDVRRSIQKALKIKQKGFGRPKLSIIIFFMSLLGILLVSINLSAVENPGANPNSSNVVDAKSRSKNRFYKTRAKIYKATSQNGPLTAPSGNIPVDVVTTFLRARGYAAQAINTLTTVKTFKDITNTTQIRMEQKIDGLKVYDKYIKAAINKNGELEHLVVNIVNSPPGSIIASNVLHDHALDAVIKRYYPDLLNTFNKVSQNDHVHTFSKGNKFYQNPTVTTVAIPLADESVIEGYLVETWDNDNVLRHVLVNGQARVIHDTLLTRYDSYNVFQNHPLDSEQTIVFGPDIGNVQSPDGWVFSDTTIGNNADVYLDVDADNLPDLDGRPISASQDFLNESELNLPSNTVNNQMSAVQNAFYWVNVVHDEMHKAGFIDYYGAFQVDNFDSFFMIPDPVLVEIQEGGGKNDGNMSTHPKDGYSPRMQLYIWDKSVPERDGALDSDIIWHEYMHGVTVRMIDSVFGPVGGAFGEGMSDAVTAIMSNDDVIAEYSSNDSGGIRRYPFKNFPGTYKHFLLTTEIHANGEFFAAAMWKLWELWQENGHSRDELIFSIVQGIGLMPFDPTFGEARDKIIQYMDISSNQQCLAWEAFAFYGIGVNSSITLTPDGQYVTGVNESFDLPTFCLENDAIVPGDISDLALVKANSRTVELSFTSSGDDGLVGTASSYDLRYSTQPIDATNYDLATEVLTEPRPNISGTVQTVTVSNLVPGTTYYFAMKSKDNGGNDSGLSNVTTATMSPSVDVYIEDFENSNSNWQIDGTDGLSGSALWHLSSNRYQSSNTAFYYGIEGTLNYDTGAAHSGSITSLPIDLTTSVDSWLTFSQYLETEGINDFYDMTRVEASADNGITWESVHVNNSDTTNQMIDINVDLSKYDSKIIQLRFSFDTFDEAANTFEGWVIDDVRISSTDTGLNNVAPIADTGINQLVDESVTVQLNGIDSIDQDGSIESYAWVQTAGPVVLLQNAFTHVPTFLSPTVAVNTVLSFELTVTDNYGVSDTDQTFVTVVVGANISPVANASTNQTVNEGALVSLNGNGSSDSDGIITTYSWLQIAGPFVEISNLTEALKTFTAPAVSVDTVLSFKLTVIDNFGDSSTDFVDITVQNSNLLPTANAGQDQFVNEGTIVTFDGSSSSDTDGTILSYLWTQTVGPEVTLSDTSSVSVSFTAPPVTTNTILTFELTVIDNVGESSTDVVNITVQDTNILPVANAGPDQIVIETDPIVQFNASLSSDIDGSIINYQWVQTAGLPVSILDNNSLAAFINVPTVHVDTILTFQLTVTDSDGGTSIDSIIVSILNINRDPISNAGPDQIVNSGDAIILDGSLSHDPDSQGFIVSYVWTQISGPAIILTDPTTSTPSFIFPDVTVSTAAIFDLTVTDNEGAVSTDSVSIIIDLPNQLPIANAGTDSTSIGGELYQLDGTGSTDADGNIVSYSWVQPLFGGPYIEINNPDTATPTFTSPCFFSDGGFFGPGTKDVKVQLTITDNAGGSSTDEIIVTVDSRLLFLTSNAGLDQIATSNSIVTLDGSASSTIDNVIINYNWTQTAGPAVTIIDPNTTITTFTAPDVSVDTVLTFELSIANDGFGCGSSVSYVNVTIQPAAANQLPVANAGLDQTINEGAPVSLDGTGSSDLDGTIVGYLWTQTAGPAVTLTGDTTSTPSFNSPAVAVDTILTFQLSVTDDIGATATDFVGITVLNSNILPTANAGVDQSVHEDVVVTLDGSASTDSDGTIASYDWIQTAGPVVSLTNASSVLPSFTAPNVSVDTVLTFQLTTTDNVGESSADIVNITVVNVNQLPVANPGLDQAVNEGVSVSLNGTGSNDPDGSIVTYSWIQTVGPTVVLAGSTTPTATFTAPDVTIDTIFTFQLTVTDNDGATATNLTNVTVQNVNQLPTANSGVDQSVNEADAVVLNGSASSDPDGTLTSYAWLQIAGPTVTLTSANSVSASFTAPDVSANTILTFQLTVTDSDASTATDLVEITVQNVNQVPVANVGVDQIVNEGDLVNLDGSTSTDTDGTITGYNWTQTAGPIVTLSGSTTATPSFAAPSVTVDMVLTFQLTVIDNDAATSTALTNVTVQNVNGLPTANAGVDQIVNESDAVTLDGNASSDPDGTIASYFWIQTAGTVVALSGSNTAIASFTAPNVLIDSVLTFQLTVTDNDGGIAMDLVNITVQNVNQLPIANAGIDQTVNEGDVVGLDSSASSDTDGTIITYMWVQTAGPGVSLTGAATAIATFTAPDVTTNTVFTFQVTATDNDGGTSSDLVNVTVQNVNQLPTASAGIDQTVNEGAVVALDGSTSSDTDGSIVEYAWVQTAGPSVTLTGAALVTASFTAPDVTSDSVLSFQLTVTDNDGGVNTDLINITVQNINQLPIANAGIDQTVNELDVVSLNGSASNDPDGSLVQYAWIQIAGPSVTLTGAATVIANFNSTEVIVDSVLTFQLTVTDNDGASVSDVVNVTVVNVNQLPVANAGIDQSVNEGVVVNINGSGSVDNDGSIASYAWVQTAGPAVTLTGELTSVVSFTAPDVTTTTNLIFQLTVIDNNGATASDSVVVSVQNVSQLPIANAGIDQIVNEGDAVVLDAAGSSDPDGTITAYNWIQTIGPGVVLTGSTTNAPSFAALNVTVDTVLTFELTVTDNDGGSSTDTVSVTVLNINQLPIANAGIDQIVNDGASVTLDGSASLDADGIIASYNWIQTVGTTVVLNGANSISSTFTAVGIALNEVLTFELTVTDNSGDIAIDTVNITVSDVQALNKEFYILNPQYANVDLYVVSLADNNIIRAGNTTLILNQNEKGVIPAVELTQGTFIAGSEPFSAGSDVAGINMPASVMFSGETFVIPHHRGTHYYEILNVSTSAANVDIDAGSGGDFSITVNEGQIVTVNAGSDNSIATVITSSTPILILHRAVENSVTKDVFPVPPAEEKIVGMRSEEVLIGAYNNETSVVVFSSDGRVANFLLDQGEQKKISFYDEYQGTISFRILASDLVSAIKVVDNSVSGSENILYTTAFWEEDYLSTHYGIPVSIQEVMVVCPESDTTVSLYEGSILKSIDVCFSDESYPGLNVYNNVTTGTDISNITHIDSSDPIYVIYRSLTSNTESNLLGEVSSSDEEDDIHANTVPVASPGGPYTSDVFVGVSFDGNTSSDADNDNLSYSWFFGDGTSATGVNPLHTYSNPGTYLVTLIVNDGIENSLPVSTTVTISIPNNIPVADPGGPYTTAVNSAINFSGTGSSDLDGETLTYTWDFGDSTVGTGISPSHTYLTQGTFIVTLTVNDGISDSLAVTTTVDVTAANQLPVAVHSGPYSGVIGDVIIFDGSLSTDPELSTLTYLWDFGDGSSASGVNPSHTYAAVGTYVVTLTVNDGTNDSLVVSTTSSVNLGNQAPTANVGGPYSGAVNTAISFNGSASSDPESDSLTFLWSFGDSATGTGQNPTHTYTVPGDYVVSLIVNDGSLNSVSSIATVTVLAVGNNAPQISGVSASPVVISDVETAQLQVTASDPDLDTLTYNWIALPGEGSFNNATTANPIYTPPDVVGTQTYTLTAEVSDGATTDTQTINISVVDADGPGGTLLDPVITLGGNISVNSILQANQAYQVTSNLIVDPGVTLTIQDGATLTFASLVGLDVNGTLLVQGTSANNVQFLPDTPSTSWSGINLRTGSVGNVIRHAQITNSGITLDNTQNAVISNNTITDAGTGISATNGASGIISDNTVTRVTQLTFTFAISLANVDFEITGNTLNNFATGLKITNSTVKANNGNVFSNLNVGVDCISGLVNINNSSFITNFRNINGGNCNIDARYNWWGDTDVVNIAASIEDYSDRVPYSYFNGNLNVDTSGLVVFTPYLDALNGNPVVMNFLDGILTSDTVLTGNTTYIVGGSVVVPVGVTLSIPPGITLQFADNGGRLSIDGTLISAGTAAQPITLTSARVAPGKASWNGVIIYGTSVGSAFDYTIVEYAVNAIDILGNNTVVSNSTITNSNVGINLFESASLVQNNTISDTFNGIVLEQSTAMLDSNTIENNSTDAIVLKAGASPTITNNILSGNNRHGIYILSDNTLAGNPIPVINNNQFLNNAVHNINIVVGNYVDGQNVTLDATNNWWGTTNIFDIAASIYDRSDNDVPTSKSAYVDFTPYLDGPSGNPVASSNFLSGTINTNTTLLSGQTYNVTSLIVPTGVTLTIQDGAVINFGLDETLTVDGTLIVQGTAANPVIFQVSPEAVASYTGSGTPGWSGIVINASSVGNTIDYAIFEGNLKTSGFFTAITVNGADLSVINSIFIDYYTAIRMNSGSTGTIDTNTFSTARQGNSYTLYLDESSPTVNNNTISSLNSASGTGISLRSASPVITGNSIQSTSEAIAISGTSNPLINSNNIITLNGTGIQIGGTSVANYPAPIMTGNSIYNNTVNMNVYSVTGGRDLVIDATGNWWGIADQIEIARSIQDFKYYNADNLQYASPVVNFDSYLDMQGGVPIALDNYLDGIIITDTTLLSANVYTVGKVVVPVGVTLTIQAGTTLQFISGGLIIDGSLVVQGVLGQPVVFTSTESPKAKADWIGIYITNTATTATIDYATIEYADRGVYFNAVSGTVSNSIIQQNTYGIYAEGASNPSITDNVIIYNTYGIYLLGKFDDLNNPQPIITGNDFEFNTSGDLYLLNYGSASTIVINASGNWWGTATPIIGSDIVLSGTTATVDTTGAATEKLSGPKILNFALDNSAISPNGDGIKDTVTVSANTDALANWIMTITDSSSSTVRTYTGSSTAINQVWDGRDTLNVVVSSGTYTIRIDANNATSGNPTLSPVSTTIIVDNEGPQALITSPIVGSTISNTINVTGTASGASALDYYLLDYGLGATPTSWTHIGTSSTSVINGTLMNWVTNPFVDNAISDGIYTLRLTVVDTQGKTAIDSVLVTLDNLIITNVSRTNVSIEPTRLESTDIDFTVDQTAQVVVRIVPELSVLKINGDQSPELDAVRTMNLGTLVSGPHTVIWDGKDDAGNYVPDEAYIYVIEGTTVSGQYAKFNQYNTEPTITPILPFDYTIPIEKLTGLNPYTNDYISDQFQVIKGPARWSLNVSGTTVGSTTFGFHPQYNVIVEPGVVQNIFWDGRDELGDILNVKSVDYIPVGINGDHEYTPLKSNYIVIKGGTPKMPGVSIKADPYIVNLSYGQITRIKYSTQDSANISITVKNPTTGLESTILNNDPQSAGNHEFVWDGTNAGILAPDEGHYTFKITATHARTGFSTVRRGNITIFK